MALTLPHIMDSAVTGDDGGRFHSKFTLIHYRDLVSSSEGGRECQVATEEHRWESSETQETEVAQQQQVWDSKETQVKSLLPPLRDEEALVNGAQHRGQQRPRHPVIRDASSPRNDASLKAT